MKIHIKGDERILGDSDFVEKVLSQASEQMERRYRLKAEGWTLTKITERVAKIFGIEKDQVVVAGKQPDRVRARSVPAYWAIRYLGLTATEVGKYLGLSKSAVSRAATRSQKLIVDQFLSLKDYKRVISTSSPFLHRRRLSYRYRLSARSLFLAAGLPKSTGEFYPKLVPAKARIALIGQGWMKNDD